MNALAKTIPLAPVCRSKSARSAFILVFVSKLLARVVRYSTLVPSNNSHEDCSLDCYLRSTFELQSNPSSPVQAAKAGCQTILVLLQFVLSNTFNFMLLCSLPYLTKLTVYMGCLQSPRWDEVVAIKHNLLELHLLNIDLLYEWSEAALAPLQKLQVLRIVSCTLCQRPSSQLHQVTSLR